MWWKILHLSIIHIQPLFTFPCPKTNFPHSSSSLGLTQTWESLHGTSFSSVASHSQLLVVMVCQLVRSHLSALTVPIKYVWYSTSTLVSTLSSHPVCIFMHWNQSFQSADLNKQQVATQTHPPAPPPPPPPSLLNCVRNSSGCLADSLDLMSSSWLQPYDQTCPLSNCFCFFVVFLDQTLYIKLFNVSSCRLPDFWLCYQDTRKCCKSVSVTDGAPLTPDPWS